MDSLPRGRPSGGTHDTGEGILTQTNHVKTLAGRFAEQLEIWGEIRPESWEEFSEGAKIEAEDEFIRGDTFDLMEDLYGIGDPEEKYSLVVSETEERVRELWPEITAVAEILVERGRLEGDEVARIIERAREQQERGE